MGVFPPPRTCGGILQTDGVIGLTLWRIEPRLQRVHILPLLNDNAGIGLRRVALERRYIFGRQNEFAAFALTSATTLGAYSFR